MIGWRHLHTRAERGALGSPGFQTVACAGFLAEQRGRALDELASRAIPRSGAGEAGGRSFLLQPSPTDGDHCVLTRVEPRDDSFDGRPGNHWVESVVVPQAWLARAGWDAAAAFAAIDWWGPRRGGERIAALGGAPAELPEEELPELGPPGEDAAQRLAQLLPDRELRLALLATYAAQAKEDRDPPAPIHVVAAADDRQAELEELLLTLPLAFPPALRARRDAEGRPRCLRLVTRGGPDSLAGADLVGVPEARLEEVRGLPGVVVDLGGSVPPPAAGGEALERARRADRTLADSPGGDGGCDSDAKAAADRQRANRSSGGRTREAAAKGDDPRRKGSGEAGDEASRRPISRRTATPAATEPDPRWAPSPAPSPAERRALWQEREAAEEGLAPLLALARREREGLLRDVRDLLDGELDHLRAEAERLREELRNARQEGKRSLQEEANRLRREIQDVLDDGLDQLRRLGEDRRGAFSSRRQQVVDDLGALQDEALDELEARYRQAANALRRREADAAGRLGDLAGLPAVTTAVPFPDEDDELPPRRPRRGGEGSGQGGGSGKGRTGPRGDGSPADRSPGRSAPAGSAGAAAAGDGPWETLRAWLRRRPVWITLVTLLAAVAIAAIAWTLWPATRGPGSGAVDPGTEEGAAAGAPIGVDREAADPELAARAAAATLQGDRPSVLLRRALEREPLQDRGAQAWVMLALGSGRPLAEPTSCALLQQAVRDWQVANGRPALSVDGACGPGTQQAVATVAPRVGCSGGAWTEEAACILERRIGPRSAGAGNAAQADASACPVSWPFARDCRWSAEEAAAFLALLRRTATGAAVVDRGRYDPVAAPQLAGRLPADLEPAAGRDLLPLAHLLERAEARALPSPAGGAVPWRTELSAEELRRVLAWLEALEAGSGAGTEGTS